MSRTEQGSFSLQRRIQVLAIAAIFVTAFMMTIGSWVIEHYLQHDAVLETRIKAEVAVEQLIRADLTPDLEKSYSADLNEIAALNPSFWYYGEMNGRTIQSAAGTPRYKDGLQGANTLVLPDQGTKCAFAPSFFFGEETTPPLRLVKIYTCGSNSYYVEVDGVEVAAGGSHNWSKWLSPSNVVGVSTRRNLVPTLVLAVILIGAVTLIFGSLTTRVRQVSAVASRIGVDEHHHTLPEEDLPKEILPIVKAVNRAIARLEEAGKKQELFMAAAAHELRTPLAIHRAKLEELPDNDLKRELDEDMQQMAAMITQLLALAKLGAVNQNFEVVNLTSVVEETCVERGSVAIGNGKTLSLEVSDGTAEVLGDKSAIHSAVANLVDNALACTGKGGNVVVRVDGTVVEVSDDGPGIQEKDMDQVFEPFFKNPPNKRGHGLGLAIVAEVMRIHGGTVSVQNSQKSGGAVFTLEFSRLNS